MYVKNVVLTLRLPLYVRKMKIYIVAKHLFYNETIKFLAKITAPRLREGQLLR